MVLRSHGCTLRQAFTIQTIFPYTPIYLKHRRCKIDNPVQVYCFVNASHVGYLLPSSCVGIIKQTKQKNKLYVWMFDKSFLLTSKAQLFSKEMHLRMQKNRQKGVGHQNRTHADKICQKYADVLHGWLLFKLLKICPVRYNSRNNESLEKSALERFSV